MSTEITTAVSVGDIADKLVSIIEAGFGADISAANKGRVELASRVIGGLLSVAEPHLQEHIDLEALLVAVSEGEDAIIHAEASAKKLLAIFGEKKQKQAEEVAPAAEAVAETHDAAVESAPAETATEGQHHPF